MTLQYELLTYPIWQIGALMALLLGVVSVIMGVRLSKRTTLSRWQNDMWQRHLSGVAFGEEPREYSDEDLRAAQRQWLGQLGAWSVGAGIGLLVGAAVSFAVAMLALRVPFSLPPALESLLYVPTFWGMIIGSMYGGIFAARRNGTSGGGGYAIAEADISHSVSDYRSPLMLLILAFPAFAYTTVTILVAPYYQPFSSYDLRAYALIPPPHWVLVLYPCAAFLTVIVIECCVWVRVKAAAVITSPDTTLARRLSMGVLVRHVVWLYSMVIFVPLIMGSGAMDMLSNTPGSMNYDALTFRDIVIVTLKMSLPPVLLISGMVILVSEGRMGGRLTGWPWGSNRAAQDNGAAAEARGDGAV